MLPLSSAHSFSSAELSDDDVEAQNAGLNGLKKPAFAIVILNRELTLTVGDSRENARAVWHWHVIENAAYATDATDRRIKPHPTNMIGNE